jgi:hypothetical protein
MSRQSPLTCRAWFCPDFRPEKNLKIIVAFIRQCRIITLSAMRLTSPNNIMTSLQEIEIKANKVLAATPADQRPMSIIPGQRIQSVAYSAKGAFEALTTNGHAVFVEKSQVENWIK